MKVRYKLIAQLVKNTPVMQETLVRFLGWEDPLEKGKATHSSILAWRIPWTILSMWLQRSSRQIGGETVETVTDFIFGGSKITVDGDCSHEIKRRLLLERKVMTNLDSILKSRDITLPTLLCLVKAMFFPIVTDGCESWTLKKSEH